MPQRTRRTPALLRLAALVATAGLAAAPAVAQERPADDVKRDLFSVIALEGLPCGAVVEARKLGENDYLAVCRTGDRYRVHIEGGRVRVERR